MARDRSLSDVVTYRERFTRFIASRHIYQRNVYLLLSYTLGKGLQLSISAISINLYAYSLGYRSAFIGVLAAMPSIGTLCSSIPIGLAADRFGRKPLIIASGILVPLSLLGVAESTAPAPLLIAQFLNGVVATAYWVTNLPMLTESTSEEERVGAIALNSFLLLGVGALGSLIGGIVPEIAGHLLHMPARSVVPLRCSVLAAVIITAVTAIPLGWLRETRRTHAPAPRERGDRAGDRAMRWQIVTLFAMLLIPDILIVFGESSVVGLLQLFFALRFQLGPGQLGGFLTAAGLSGGAAALLSPRFVRRWGKLRVATLMPYLSVPVVLCIGFAPVAWLAAGAEFIRNVLRGCFDPVYASFVMERAPERHRATLSGFYGITWGVGYSVGAAVAGTLQQHVSLSAPFVVGALCLALAPTLLLTFFGKNARTGRPTRRNEHEYIDHRRHRLRRTPTSISRLVDEGEHPRCLVRNADRARQVLPAAAELVQGNTLHPDTLDGACEGVEVIVHAGFMTANLKQQGEETYYNVNVDGTQNLVDAAKRAAVQRIVVVSGLGTKPDKPGTYMQGRYLAEESVRDSGLGWSIIQPSVQFGPQSAFFKGLADLIRQVPLIVPVAGTGKELFQPIWVEDVVTCLTKMVREPQRDGAVYVVGGPEILTYDQILDALMDTLGIHKIKVPGPKPFVFLGATAMEALLPRPPITRAALDLFAFPNSDSVDDVPRQFGFTPKKLSDYLKQHGVD